MPAEEKYLYNAINITRIYIYILADLIQADYVAQAPSVYVFGKLHKKLLWAVSLDTPGALSLKDIVQLIRSNEGKSSYIIITFSNKYYMKSWCFTEPL